MGVPVYKEINKLTLVLKDNSNSAGAEYVKTKLLSFKHSAIHLLQKNRLAKFEKIIMGQLHNHLKFSKI